MTKTREQSSRLQSWLRPKYIISIAIIAVAISTGCTVSSEPLPEPVPPPPEPVNKPPIINYVTGPQEVVPSYDAKIRCVASDLDGDTLTYSWSTDAGKITGTEDIVTWTSPPTTGKYTISVTVTDGNGGEATDSFSVSVVEKPNHAPTATLMVAPKDKQPFEPGEEPVTVRRWSTVDIECIAQDPDGDDLKYEWAASDGKIDGEGSKVTYIASATGDHAITATVIDSRGAEFKTSVYFHVPCCGAGGG